MTTTTLYGMMGDNMLKPLTSVDLDYLCAEADKCNGIVLLVEDNIPNIVYVGGESRVLGGLK
jgi:hypothetical protein